MRNFRIILMVILFSIVNVTVSFTQQRNGNGTYNIPNLTIEQKEKLVALRNEQQLSSIYVRNQIRENSARLVILQTSNIMDTLKINSLIDDITNLQNIQWKKRIYHKQVVRNLLTEEQIKYYNINSSERNHHNQRRKYCNQNY